MAQYANKRILVVDDDPEILGAYANMLSGRSNSSEKKFFLTGKPSSKEVVSFDCSLASNGAEGVELVRSSITSGRLYAAAFIDMRMPPGINGLETIKRIRKIDPFIQLVQITAYSDATLDELLKFGKHSIYLLKKPFSMDEIRTLAHSLCQKWNLAEADRLHPKDFSHTGEDGWHENAIKEAEKISGQIAEAKNSGKEMFENVLSNSIPMIITDAKWKIRKASTQMLKVLGYDESEALGKSITAVLAKGQGASADDFLKTSDGTLIPTVIVISVIYVDADMPIGAVLIFRDGLVNE